MCISLSLPPFGGRPKTEIGEKEKREEREEGEEEKKKGKKLVNLEVRLCCIFFLYFACMERRGEVKRWEVGRTSMEIHGRFCEMLSFYMFSCIFLID